MLCVMLALRLASLGGAIAVLEIMGRVMIDVGFLPHESSVRLWIMKIGYYELHRPKEQADDWAYVVDHSVQIGEEKCLAILGVRLSKLPPKGQALTHQDMELISLEPCRHANGEQVQGQLEQAALKTGIPRMIASDHGSDLTSGIARFRRDHPETCDLYDMKHKAACVLKNELAHDEKWKAFCAQAGKTKSLLQQTELAFLAPPSGRSKSRYMNLETLINWGQTALEAVKQKPAEVLTYCTAERLEEKLGWLRDYEDCLPGWGRLQHLAAEASSFITRQGVYQGVEVDLNERLTPLAECQASQRVKARLVDFSREQGSQAKADERLVGSTEVLESVFGKVKALEGEQSKSGFTGYMLSLGAVVSRLTVDRVREALSRCRLSDIRTWCREKLGATIQSKRKRCRDAVRKKQKPEETEMGLT